MRYFYDGKYIEISECPFCKSSEIMMSPFARRHYVRCRSCYARGPRGETPELSAEMWNKARGTNEEVM